MVHIILLSIFVIAVFSRKNKQVLAIAFVMLFCFAAFRFEFGNDYVSYRLAHSRIRRGEDSLGIEILSTFLNLIAPNYYIYIAITSFIFVYALWKLITKNVPSKLAWISVFVLLINPYLFLMNLSTIRQCMALVVFMKAISYSRKKNWVVYCAFVVIASLFHKSAIVLLVFYPWLNENKVTKWMMVTLIGILFVLLLSPQILLNMIEKGISVFDSANYRYYFNNSSQNSLRATLLQAVSLVYILINLPNLSGKALLYSKAWLISAILYVLAYRLAVLTRFEMYFGIYSVVAFPLVISESFKKNKRGTVLNFINRYIFPILIVIIYILKYYSFFTAPVWESFLHYRTIFFQ